MTTEKHEETKMTANGMSMVKYWTVNLAVSEKPLDENTVAIVDDAYAEFASALDRSNEPDREPTPF
jgi:hypothetical protein